VLWVQGVQELVTGSFAWDIGDRYPDHIRKDVSSTRKASFDHTSLTRNNITKRDERRKAQRKSPRSAEPQGPSAHPRLLSHAARHGFEACATAGGERVLAIKRRLRHYTKRVGDTLWGGKEPCLAVLEMMMMTAAAATIARSPPSRETPAAR
jgi:hypothetical protein